MTRSLVFGILCTLLSSGACSAKPDDNSKMTKNAASAPPVECAIPPDSFNKLPGEVLAGTDLLPFNAFKTNNRATLAESKFLMEMGGATIQVKITPTNGTVSVVREYMEPGIPAESKSYDVLCAQGSQLYGEKFRGYFVEEGLLWLELESGSDFIPADLWLLMTNKTN